VIFISSNYSKWRVAACDFSFAHSNE
jgi:hypothetical protein